MPPNPTLCPRPSRPAAGALLALAALIAGPAAADGVFASVAASHTELEIAGQTFRPVLARLEAGWFWDQGLAVTAQVSAEAQDDSALGFDAGVETLASALLRFESPEQDGFRLAISGGYSQARITLRREDGSGPGRETFAGPALGLLAAQRLGDSRWSVTAAFVRHYDREGVDLRTLSLGLQYDVR